MATHDRAGDILARFPGPVTLYPSRVKWFLVFLLGAGFSAGGVWMATESPLGWFVTVFFGLMALIAAIALLPGAGWLRLDRDGFESAALFRHYAVRWQDTSGFAAARIPTTDQWLVVFDYAPARGLAIGKLNVRLMGRNGSLSDTYGLSAESLAQLMARWHERATA